MRKDVALGRYSVPDGMASRPCSRPAKKLPHTAGLAPSKYKSNQLRRWKLRINAKDFSERKSVKLCVLPLASCQACQKLSGNDKL